MRYCNENGKECFGTKGSALRAAERMGGGSVYRCQYCNQWHITHYTYEHSKAIRELFRKGVYSTNKKRKKKDMRIFVDTQDGSSVMVDTYQPPEDERKGIMLAFTKEPTPIAVGLTYEQALELAEALKIQTARI